MYIASIASDIKVHLWPTGNLSSTYKVNDGAIPQSISWSKDGKWLVTVPSKGHAELINVRENSLKNILTLKTLAQPSCAVFQNVTRKHVGIGTNTGNVLLYDVKQRLVKRQFPCAISTVVQLAFTSDDNYLFAGCENGTILYYNCFAVNYMGSYSIPCAKTLSRMRTHPSKRNLLIAGCEEGIVAVWDVFKNNIVYKNQVHNGVVTDVTFAPRKSELIVTCGDHKLSFWDMGSNNQIFQHTMDRFPTAIDFCSDGINLTVGTESGTIYTYDTRHMTNPIYVFKAHNSLVKQILIQKGNHKSSDFVPPSYKYCKEISFEESPRGHGDSYDPIFQNSGYKLDIKEYPTTDTLLTKHVSTSCLEKQEIQHTFNTAPNLLESIDESCDCNCNCTEIDDCIDKVEIKRDIGTPEASKLQEQQSNLLNEKSTMKELNSTPNGESKPKVVKAEVQRLMREMVRQEVKFQLDDFHASLKYDILETITQMRKHFLDLRMCIVKESVLLENNINKLRNEIRRNE